MVSVFEWLETLGAGGVIVLGAILLFFPEPTTITSWVGIALLIIGIGLWITEWRERKRERAAEA